MSTSYDPRSDLWPTLRRAIETTQFTDQAFTYLFWLFVALFFAVTFRGIHIRPKHARVDDTVFRFLLFSWAATFSALAIIFIVGLAISLSDPTKRLFLSPKLGSILIALGGGLFVMKRRALLIYGIIEAGAAIGVIVILSLSHQEVEPRLISGLAAMYFLIRGLDNLTKANPVKGWIEKIGLNEKSG